MEHITTINNTNDENSDVKNIDNNLIMTGTTIKKKTNKTKENYSNENSIEDIHTNNTNNGIIINGDYNNSHEEETNNDLIEINNRFDNNETELLVDRINEIDLNKTSSNLTNIQCPECNDDNCTSPDSISFESYKNELQMGEIMRLIQKDLSEPYSIYTYRYFIHNWPKLCFLAMHNKKCIGAIVCKLDIHRKVKRGYIAMLAVDEKYRKRKIGSHLVRQAITAMVADDADEVVLETEITNKPALRLYGNLGFVRDKRLFRYYLNGVDALRLKLWLR